MKGRFFEFAMDHISDASEFIKHFRGDLFLMWRIGERPMEADAIARKGRAGLLGAITDGNDVVKMLAQKIFGVLGPLVRNIDPDLLHDLNGSRVDNGWLDPGARPLLLAPAIVA